MKTLLITLGFIGLAMFLGLKDPNPWNTLLYFETLLLAIMWQNASYRHSRWKRRAEASESLVDRLLNKLEEVTKN